MSKETEMQEIVNRIASAQKSAYIPKCPRCGSKTMERTTDSKTFGSLSRRADIYICDKCGIAEAMEDYFGTEKLPLSQWALFGSSDKR